MLKINCEAKVGRPEFSKLCSFFYSSHPSFQSAFNLELVGMKCSTKRGCQGLRHVAKTYRVLVTLMMPTATRVTRYFSRRKNLPTETTCRTAELLFPGGSCINVFEYLDTTARKSSNALTPSPVSAFCFKTRCLYYHLRILY
jgi:hypothetical protein